MLVVRVGGVALLCICCSSVGLGVCVVYAFDGVVVRGVLVKLRDFGWGGLFCYWLVAVDWCVGCLVVARLWFGVVGFG